MRRRTIWFTQQGVRCFKDTHPGRQDANPRPSESYKAVGGNIQFQLFEGAEHEWVTNPGPLTDRAREMVKAFIARQLKT